MKTIYILFFTLFSFVLFAQPPVEMQIFSENIGDPGDTSINVFFYQDYQNEGLTFIGPAFVESNEPSTGYPGASGAGNIFFDYGRTCRVSGINTQNYSFLKISFGLHKDSEDSDGSELTLMYSTNGFTFFPLSFTMLPTGDGTAGWYYVTASFPPPAGQNVANLVLLFTNNTSENDPIQFRIDDISMEGLYFTPTISPSDTSFLLPPVVIGEYDSIEYTVSAVYLIQDVEIVSENPSFEIYDPVDSVWGSELTLLKDSLGPMDTVTILVRHSPLDAIGDEVGVFRHSTFGGPDTIVRVYGTAIATEPLEVTSTFTATATQEGTISLTWTAGDGDRRLIIAREGVGFPVNYIPTDGEFPLVADQDFSEAPDSSGNRFVYDGTDNNTIIYGLNPSTTYHFRIFEYNVGTGNSQNYLTSSFKDTMETTVPGPPGLQVEQTSTAYFINFQDTVPNVLNGAYDGSGLSPAGLPGKLNSSSWKISLRQNSASSYYGNHPLFTYALGKPANIDIVSLGGIYAFDTGEENIALGVKPQQGTNNSRVFTNDPGGFFELKSQNKTNQTVTEAYVSFVYYVYNNGPASTTFKLFYSLNEFNSFTEKAEMQIVTPADSDAVPGWKKHVRSVKISELNLPPNGFLYIRWSGADSSNNPGNDTRDAIAIDDITIAFNPDNEFAGGTFEGTVHSGVLAANAQLSDSALIVDSLILQDSAVLSTGVQALTLGPNVSIDETDGYIKGNLLVSRVIEANVAQTFGGIGLSIETDEEAGMTHVKRVTGQIVPFSNLPSIHRYFEIEPEINAGLNATLAFTFKDFESPDFIPTQQNFRLFQRPIGSTGDWTTMAEGNLVGTTYTVNGISSFNIQITGADPNAPLPLNWISFDVSHNKGFNLLKWVTADEVNTSVFEVEKSYNAKDFTSVAVEPARGGIFSETYQYTDKHDRSGMIYYRVKQIDHDQKFAYSPLRSVMAHSYQKVQVYPTIVSGETMIHSDKEMEAQITVVNARGTIVKQLDFQLSSGDQPFSVNDLLPGVYWIRIENKEISETFRIVKQ